MGNGVATWIREDLVKAGGNVQATQEVFNDPLEVSLQGIDMRLNDSQFRDPHTGILYTPPSYSDHVPVCALLKGKSGLLAGLPPCTQAKKTKKCTPWVAQSSLL